MDATTTPSKTVRVELFGVPRILAGSAAVAVEGTTLADVAAGLLAACPALSGSVIDPGTRWLAQGYTFVVNDRFTRHPADTVSTGTSVLLVSSVAGG